MEQVREFVALEKEKKELQAWLVATNQKLTALDEAITTQLVAEGITGVDMDGRRVTVSTDIYAGPIEGQKQNVIDALRSLDDTAALVTTGYTPAALNKFVREVAADVEAACEQDPTRMYDVDAVRAALPPALAAVIKVSFVYVLRSRKA